VPAAAGGERWGKVTPFLQRHSASGRMPESLFIPDRLMKIMRPVS
jgi:hypothetical protein